MFLRCKVRRKDGKQHRYWSVVENTRVAGGRMVQRHVMYLGEINDLQELAGGVSAPNWDPIIDQSKSIDGARRIVGFAGVPISADRDPMLIEFGMACQCLMLLRQRVPIGCRFTAHDGPASETLHQPPRVLHGAR